jgi:DNA-binding CsgD family transcriptional regulator
VVTATFEERADELAMITRVLEQTASGAGRVLLVEGEPGIGKTSLLARVAREAPRLGLTALTVRCLQLDHDTSYAAVRSLCLSLAHEIPQLDEVEDAGPLATSFLTGQVPTGVDPFLVRHALTELLTQASTRKPLAVLVDDGQWADDLSLAWLVHLAGAVAEVPLAVIVAVRTGAMESRPVLTRLAVAGSVQVGALQHEQVARLVAELVPHADSALVDACRQQTGGNPLMLEELLREVVARNLAASGVGSVVPDGVARSVLDRLCGLPGTVRRVVEAAAVAGDGTPVRHVAAAVDLPTDQVGVSLDELARAGFVTDARPVEFTHPLVQRAVLAQIRRGQRSRLHRRLAVELAAEGNLDRAAAHLMEVEPAGDPWVVTTLQDQARVEISRGAPRSAARLLGRALVEPPEPPARPTILTELGEAGHLSGSPEAIAHLREALALAGVDRTRVARVLAQALTYHGDPAQAAELLARTRDAVRAVSPDDALALDSELLVLSQIEHSSAQRAAARIEASLTGDGPGTPAAHMLAAVRAYQATVAWRGTAKDASGAARWAFENGLLDEAGSGSPAVGFGMMTLVIAGHPSTATAVLDRAWQDAEQHGSARGIAVVATLRARLALLTGDLQAAEVEGVTALTVSAEAHPVMVPFALACLVLALAQQGLDAQAEQRLEDFSLASGDVAPTAMAATLLYGRMVLRLGQRRYDEALADLDWLRPMGRGRADWPSMWTPEVIATLAAVGRTDEAREVAERHVGDARSWGNQLALAAALHARACLDPGGSLGLLHEALDVVPPWAPLMRARIVTELGGVLRRSNQRAGARPYLTEGWQLAHQCHAYPLAERARAELAATGARPRKIPRVGAAALTASERRVADLACAGHSNAEIAQSLYVTRKTVEKHLTSVYAKLGVNNRRELAQALRAPVH